MAEFDPRHYPNTILTLSAVGDPDREHYAVAARLTHELARIERTRRQRRPGWRRRSDRMVDRLIALVWGDVAA